MENIAQKSEAFENARTIMKELAEKYEKTEDPKARIDLNLYEFPKMIEAIKLADDPSIKDTPEYKRMQKYGLDFYEEIKHQEEIENGAQGYTADLNKE
jgi:hypothetical protein